MNAQILCNWQPSHLDAATIKREFLQLCAARGVRLCGDSLEVRGPSDHAEARWRQYSDPAFDWHKDEGGALDRLTDRIVVMWSNVLPTEVAAGYERLKARDGDVLLVDNLTTRHRVPKGVEHANRWFVRGHVHK